MSEWKSDALDKLCAALAAAQGAFQTIGRNREVTVKTNTGGTYKFKYAPLDEILNAVRPALSKNGLSVSQMIAGDVLRTTLMHSSGQWLAAEAQMPPRPAKMQELGSMLTYLRRYALVAMLGVASEEDDDANTHDGNDWQAAPYQKPRAPAKRGGGGKGYEHATGSAEQHAPPTDSLPVEEDPSDAVPIQHREPGDEPVDDGCPADLKAILGRIAAAKSMAELTSVAVDAGQLEISLRATARTAYTARKRTLEGK